MLEVFLFLTISLFKIKYRCAVRGEPLCPPWPPLSLQLSSILGSSMSHPLCDPKPMDGELHKVHRRKARADGGLSPLKEAQFPSAPHNLDT